MTGHHLVRQGLAEVADDIFGKQKGKRQKQSRFETVACALLW
jgi:hypothetical protein